MQWLRDYAQRPIRLTDERLAHIQLHPEMADMISAIAKTLASPSLVVRSLTDEQVRLYYRFYSQTIVGGKWLCVVVKITDTDAFIVTAYLTDKPKKGEVLWNAKS